MSSFAESHITEIFGGKMRSAVHHQGAKESATVQPFFTLPLDIQVNSLVNYYTEIQFVIEDLFQHKQVYYCICVGRMLYFQWILASEWQATIVCLPS